MDPDIVSISEWTKNLSLDELFSGNFEAFTALFYLIFMIALYSIVIFHFYRYIARRDCFKESKRKHSKLVGSLKYLFLFPFVAIIFFVGFSLILISLTREGGSYNIESILALSFAIIVAIRVTAYYTEELSRDVAKMLPFAILAIFLIDSSYFKMDAVITRISTLPTYVNGIIQYLVLIIIVEWILRVGLTIRYLIFPKKDKPAVEEA